MIGKQGGTEKDRDQRERGDPPRFAAYGGGEEPGAQARYIGDVNFTRTSSKPPATG